MLVLLFCAAIFVEWIWLLEYDFRTRIPDIVKSYQLRWWLLQLHSTTFAFFVASYNCYSFSILLLLSMLALVSRCPLVAWWWELVKNQFIAVGLERMALLSQTLFIASCDAFKRYCIRFPRLRNAVQLYIIRKTYEHVFLV